MIRQSIQRQNSTKRDTKGLKKKNDELEQESKQIKIF